MLFDFDDILIEPEIHTSIRSRKHIDAMDEKQMLPLFTAPMDTVINEDNVKVFNDNKIYGIIPRKANAGLDHISTDYKVWYSYGLDDFKKIFIDNDINLRLGEKSFALIDVANGHMNEVKDLVVNSKEKYGRTLVLMVGNCANPLTFLSLSQAGADYVRMGIGNGCFVPGSMVRTNKGSVSIEEISKGDYVLTHNNRYRAVEKIYTYKKDETITYINGIGSTSSHEYYIIEKKYSELINDKNIHEYAKWIPAGELSEEEHLLIEMK